MLAGLARRADDPPLLKRPAHLPAASQTPNPAMVTVRWQVLAKELAKKTVAIQTECLPKDVAVQIRECPSLLLPMKGGRDAACMRCKQVEDLISLVAELKEEMERLRTIRECVQELDWWSNSLKGLQERHQGDTPQTVVDPL